MHVHSSFMYPSGLYYLISGLIYTTLPNPTSWAAAWYPHQVWSAYTRCVCMCDFSDDFMPG